MKLSIKNLVVAGSLVLGIFAVANVNNAEAGKKKEVEKCYGVVKAGKNDCGSSDGAHSCAGQAAEDSSKKEWIYLPKGTCDRLTGGSTEGEK